MKSKFPPRLQPARLAGEAGGRRIGLYALGAPGGLQAAVSDHGARLLQLVVPGRGGAWYDVVLGYDSLGQMLQGMPSLGAFIGRYANRIGQSRFTLDGRAWQVPANDGPHCLHGGPAGSRHQVFEVQAHAPDRLELAWTFRSAHDGFPGDVALRLTYALPAPATLAIEWAAQALDRASVVNFTAHPFFNLEGAQAPHARDHHLTINATHYLPVDAHKIPTGVIAPVEGTPLDLRAGTTLAQALQRLPAGQGFDHCYVMAQSGTLRPMARARAPGSGVVMHVWSDAPGLQFFSASGFDGSLPRHAGKAGRAYGPEAGLCLEPQGLPDAPNQPGFPSTVLRPGHPRRGRIEFRFSVED
ncbi:MAG: hypothetical protein RIS88_401 [Pseudomonadota bacterium]|jgi:aldose 1-epimerase